MSNLQMPDSRLDDGTPLSVSTYAASVYDSSPEGHFAAGFLGTFQWQQRWEQQMFMLQGHGAPSNTAQAAMVPSFVGTTTLRCQEGSRRLM
jgi:hypothetical protein